MSQNQATPAPAEPAEPLPMEIEPASFLEVETLPPTDRGEGGFGSTGH